MAAYNDRVPLKDGTVLHTTDGKRFHILHSTSIGGSAILYSAHLDGSSLDVTLKEFYPAGCVRVNGVALDPGLAAPGCLSRIAAGILPAAGADGTARTGTEPAGL